VNDERGTMIDEFNVPRSSFLDASGGADF